MEISKREMLEYMLRFAHLEKVLAILPGVNDATCAALWGIGAEMYREIREQFVARIRQAAAELLTDPAFASQVDRVPFARGAKVVGFGSSSVDDAQSWFEILRQVFAQRRPQDELSFVNAGLSNDSTTHLIARFADVVKERPDWIICHISANDARRHGRSATKTLVSPAETEANLGMLRHFAAGQTHARWLWLAPTPMIEERIAANPMFAASQATVSNNDLGRVAEIVLRQPDPAINLWQLFGQPADPDLVLWDGVHPTLKGHVQIVKALIEHLSHEA